MRSNYTQFIALSALFILAAVGCGRDSNTVGDELIYWSANNPYEQEVARAVVKEWNELHPDMPVRHQPIPEGQSSEEVILAAIVGETTPDIYSNVWPGDTEFYVRANAVVRLDQFPDCEPFLKGRCPEDLVEHSRSRDGHIYQVPWKTNPVMMQYNVKMFRDVGFDSPPRTYSEYFTAAEKIVKLGTEDRPIWVGLRNIKTDWWQRFFDFYTFYLAASGGKTLVRGDSILFKNAAAVGVFDFFQTMYRNSYFPLQNVSRSGDLLLLERVASRFTGPWEIIHTEKFKPEGFEYDFAPIPVPDDYKGPAYTYGDPKNIVIFSTCSRPEAAWEFVKFLVSRQNDHLLLELATQLPLRKDLLTDPLFRDYFEENPRLRPFAEQAQFVRGVDQSPVMKEIFDAISQEYEASVLYGTKTPEQAINDVAKRVRLILE
jgi:multiple sugar transport system substrate-binding protein